MSQLGDLFISYNPELTSKPTIAEDKPGLLESSLENLKSAAESVIGGDLYSLGAQLNAMDQAGRESSFVDSIRNSDGGPLKTAGNFIINNIATPLNEDANETQQKYGSGNYGDFWDRITNPSYYTDPRGLTADVSQGIGSMIPLAATMLIPGMGEAKAAGSIASIGERLLGKIGAGKLAAKVSSDAAKGAIESGIKWATRSGPHEAISNAGGIYDDLKAQGYSDKDIAYKIRSMAAEELPMDATSELLTGAVLSGKLGGAVFNRPNAGVVRRTLQNAAVNTPTEMASEYTNEMMQQQLQNKYSNQPYGTLFNPTPDEKIAGAMGAMGALGIGGFGTARGMFKGTNNTSVSAGNESTEPNMNLPAGESLPDYTKNDNLKTNITPQEVALPDDIQNIIDTPIQSESQQTQNGSSAIKSSGNSDIDSYIQSASQQTGVPANLLSALVSAESSYNQDAKSSAGAIGLTQLMPDTANALGVDASNPAQNVLGGAMYLKQQYDKYGNWRDALIAYNEGPGALDNGTVYKESADYADGIINNAGNVPDNDNPNNDTYNLPTQGADIDAQVDGLNTEFKSALPYIGGILNDLGLADGSVISSANRTPEHNAEVGGAANSYHTHGDAVDIVLPDSTTEEQAQAVLQRFKDTGAFKEVLFHDAGSGYHLHLGGYQGGLGNGSINTAAESNDAGSKKLFDLNSSNGDNEQIGRQQIDDFANYMKDTSTNANTVNFFEGMFNTDRKGNDIFNNTPENQQKIKDNYGTELTDYIKNAQRQASAPTKQKNIFTIQQSMTTNGNAPQIETHGKNYIQQAQNNRKMEQVINQLSQPKTTGETLIQLAKDNQISMNAKLQTDLQTNKPLAIKTMQNRINQKAVKEGLNINENTESQNTETPQGINTENKISDTIPEQSEGQVSSAETINNQQTQSANAEQSINGAVPSNMNIINSKAMYSDKNGGFRGGIKDGKLTIWANGTRKNDAPITMTLADIQQAANESANSAAGIRRLAKQRMMNTTDEWINASENESLRQKRRDLWENDISNGKNSAFVNRNVDSIANVAKTLYEKATGEKPASVYEKKSQEITPESVRPGDDKTTKQKAVQQSEKQQNTSRFGSEEAAKADMLKAFGKEQKTAPEENQNTKGSPAESSADDSSLVKQHKDKVDNIINDFNSRKKNKSTTVTQLKNVMAEANADFWGRKISNTSKAEIQSYANDALGTVQKKQVELSRKRKAAKNTDEPAPKKAFNVIDDSDDALSAAIKDFDSEINNISANPMFNPKLMIAGFKIGMIHLQRGANNFADWSSKMLISSEKLKPFLKSIWESINAYPKDVKFNENQMSAVMRYIGTQYDKGITDKNQLKELLEKTIGNEYSNLIDSAYAGVINFPTKEDIKHGITNSTSGLAPRSGKRDNKNSMGTNDESPESGAGRRQSLQKAGKEGDRLANNHSFSSSGSGDGGTSGNSPVQPEKSADTGGGTGNTQLSRSITDSYEGRPIYDAGGYQPTIESSKIGRNDEGNIIRPKTKIGIKQAGNLESIKKDLPFLLPEQQEDVAFAEKRLIKNNGKGVLFTNGTGTGKTFTGLGVIKRFANAGKSNILILTPNNEIISAWVKTARKFFGLAVTPLKTTKDAGHAITITTYANMGENDSLAKREWDLIVPDEAHSLMQSEKGEPTAALDKLRALTLHSDGFDERFKMLHTDDYAKLDNLIKQQSEYENKKIGGSKLLRLEKEINNLNTRLQAAKKKTISNWEKISDNKKSKVTFLSATPFAYVPDIDYANGYLFNYGKKDSGGYNTPNGKEDFFINNFGYRMRYNKLTKPDADVDNGIMERSFHEKLRKTGALSGRVLTIDKDYDRGFILVNGGIGKKIDEGFEWLSDKNKNKNDYDDLYNVLKSQYKHYDKMYLLEAIKAKEAVDLIDQYVKSGKKVVIFHDYNKGGTSNPFILNTKNLASEAAKNNDSSLRDKVFKQYEEFKVSRPDLFSLDLKQIPSPVKALTAKYGDNILLFNGTVDKKTRSKNVQLFNDDNSNKNIILVQSDAGQAGISLHDTTGKHQRVLINLGLPTKPVAAIQTEGRIYRVGNKSNVIFRYLNTGTNIERNAFADKIAQRASTAENLALGDEARTLKESFINAFDESDDSNEWEKYLPGSKNEGTGGKNTDKAMHSDISNFDKAITFYYGQQKKTAHNKAQEGADYFATPEPLGEKMVEWAKLTSNDSVLEPSSGHGAISRWLPENTKNVIIEPSSTLFSKAKMNLQSGNAINGRFEDYHIGNKFNAVIMNPPFGTGGKTAVDHLSKAFNHLKDGGRVIAILPDGPSMQKHFDKWFYGDGNGKTKVERDGQKNAIVMKEISLPTVTFNRAGTSVKTKLLIIDRQNTPEGMKAAQSLAQENSSITADNINTLFDKLRNMNAPERIVSGQKTPSTVINAKINGSSIVINRSDKTVTGNTYPVKTVIKNWGGRWSKAKKAWIFKDDKKLNDFINQFSNDHTEPAKLSATIKNNDKISSTDQRIQKMFASKQDIAPADLTSREKAIADFAQKLGNKVQFFEGPAALNGYYQDNTTYLNRKSNASHSWTFWHELFHWLRSNNNELYNKMVDYISNTQQFTDKQLSAYKKSIGRENLTDADAIEEMMADYMPEVKNRVSFIKNLGKENSSLAQKFVSWVRSIMDKFTSYMNNPKAGLTNTQKKSMVNAFNKLAKDIVNENGQHIFSDNEYQKNLTGEQRLANDVKKWQGLCNLYDSSDKLTWKRKNNGVLFKFMDMPLVLEMIGAKNMKLNVYGSFFEHVINAKHPGMDMNVIRQLPKAMVDPMMILQGNKPNTFVFALTVKDNKGANVIVPVELQKNDDRHGIINVLNTAYSRLKHNNTTPDTQWFVRQINDSKLVYVNKEKAFHGTGHQGRLPLWDHALRNALSDSSIKTEDNLVKEKSAQPTRYSVQPDEIEKQDKSFMERMSERLVTKLEKSNGQIKINSPQSDSSFGILKHYVWSPSRIAEKVPHFRQFYNYADNAMNKLTKLRSDYSRKLDTALNLIKDKEDKKALYEILWNGDAEGKDFTKQELLDTGVKENVADAYKGIRQLMTKAYIMLNEARRRAQVKSEHVIPKRLEELKNNKFVHIIKEDDSGLVTYKEYANWTKKFVVSKEEFDRIKNDAAVQVLDYEKAGFDDAGTQMFNVNVRESIPDINKLKGYIPHFFHDYMVKLQTTDNDGAIINATIGSGRTINDAYKIAEKYLSEHKTKPTDKITVSPKVFDFTSLGLDETKYAAVMGDRDYSKMLNALAKNNDMSLKEAKELVHGSVKQKNRHRFFGNFMQRKGAEGFETDLDWVLRHYFNSASRYAALETEFKPKAISLFERLYGRFDNEYNGIAKYTKEYINDINGVPSNVETYINKLLHNRILWRYLAESNFGDRAAVQLSNSISRKISMLKLGFFNVSSAFINLTQLANAAAYTGDVKVLWQALQRGSKKKYTGKDLRILIESNVMNDIGLDSGSGYDMWRNMKSVNLKNPHGIVDVLSNANSAFNAIGNKGMVLFKQTEGAIRRGTVLAAYDKAIARGMDHKKAIEYAKEIDRKSNFDYSVSDAPNVFRRGSIFSQLALQFKKYPIKELEVMKDFLPLISNNTDKKQKMLFWGAYFLFAGALQVPFFDWFDELSKSVLGKSPRDYAIKSIMKLCDEMPLLKPLGEIALYGILAPANIDISYRAGVADVLPTRLSDVAGPTATTVSRTLGNLIQGNAMAALRSLSPSLANIVMAMTGEAVGNRGRITSQYSTPYERLLRAFGFRSVDEANSINIQSIIYDDKDRLSQDKKDAIDDYIKNPSTKNAMRLKELNVKPDTVKKERARKSMTTRQRTESSVTKDEAKNYKYMFGF